MTKLTIEWLEKNGFEPNYVSAEESGDIPYLYYTYDLYNGECLLTNALDNPTDIELDITDIEVSFLHMDAAGPYTTKEEVLNIFNAIKINKNHE